MRPDGIVHRTNHLGGLDVRIERRPTALGEQRQQRDAPLKGLEDQLDGAPPRRCQSRDGH
jgi:hypothetical protein